MNTTHLEVNNPEQFNHPIDPAHGPAAPRESRLARIIAANLDERPSFPFFNQPLWSRDHLANLSQALIRQSDYSRQMHALNQQAGYRAWETDDLHFDEVLEDFKFTNKR